MEKTHFTLGKKHFSHWVLFWRLKLWGLCQNFDLKKYEKFSKKKIIDGSRCCCQLGWNNYPEESSRATAAAATTMTQGFRTSMWAAWFPDS
jgi:hypothetical protein